MLVFGFQIVFFPRPVCRDGTQEHFEGLFQRGDEKLVELGSRVAVEDEVVFFVLVDGLTNDS